MSGIPVPCHGGLCAGGHVSHDLDFGGQDISDQVVLAGLAGYRHDMVRTGLPDPVERRTLRQVGEDRAGIGRVEPDDRAIAERPDLLGRSEPVSESGCREGDSDDHDASADQAVLQLHSRYVFPRAVLIRPRWTSPALANGWLPKSNLADRPDGV